MPVFKAPIRSGYQPPLKKACGGFDHPLRKTKLSNVQSELPLMQFWTIPTLLQNRGEELSTSLPTSPPVGAQHSSDIAPQLLSLQTSPLLARQTFQPFCLLGCLLLDVFRCLSIVLNFSGPELHTVLVHVYLLLTNIEARKGRNLQVFAFSIPFCFKYNECHFSLLNSLGWIFSFVFISTFQYL